MYANAILKERKKRTEEYEKWREILLHRSKAIEYFVKGELDRAVEEWDIVLKLDPGNPTALLFFDMIERKKQREAAKEL